MRGRPAVRTIPGAAGLRAQLFACLTVVVLLPAVAYLLAGVMVGLIRNADTHALSSAAQVLLGIPSIIAISPLLSWSGLLFGVPLAAHAARRGWAGWLVLCVMGMVLLPISLGLLLTILAGLTGHTAMRGPISPGDVAGGILALASLAPLGAIFGSAYWLALRLAAPQLFAPEAPEMAAEGFWT